MKLALVFDDLIQFGGAERLLLATHEIWPEAPVYTTVASQAWKKKCSALGIELHTSWMQKLPFTTKLNRVYSVLFFHCFAVESFRFDDFDIVLSISARYAHGILTKPQTKHICYMNSPGRMFWEPTEYFAGEKVSRKILGLTLSVLRVWDYIAAQRVDCFVANSATPQRRITKYYKRESKIIYPFVQTLDIQSIAGDYFLVISRLLAWKKIEIAITACASARLPLKIIGEGPHEKNLKKLAKNEAKDFVQFLGYVSEAEKIHHLQNCKAVIVTQAEDFGIVPLEAMAAGKPVIAFKKGGVLETVLAGKTGEFYETQNAESLKKVLTNFNPQNYDPVLCKKQAGKFSNTRFKDELKRLVDGVYLQDS